MTENIEEMLIRHEGLRFKPYKDTLGYWTIGIGRCISTKGITKEEALYLLSNDIAEARRDLAGNVFKGQFYDFPENIKLVLINMRFQLGPARFRNFKKMIIAFQNKDYKEAAVQMKDSLWYKQVTKRAEELIEMVKGEM